MLPSKFKILIALWILTLCGTIQSGNALTCWYCVGDCEDVEIKQCANTIDALADQCYMRFSGTNDISSLGCATDFDTEDEVIALIKEKLLYLCEGNNCNFFDKIPSPNDCTMCSSSSEERCATKPSEVNSKSKCNVLPYTECYERVSSTSSGLTQRGCLSDLPSEEFYDCLTSGSGNCRTCTGTSCNKEVIPANRLQCHRCDSTNQANCATTTPNALSVCPIYDANDACVTRANKDGSIVRGCRSELNCIGFSEDECRECTSQGCNTIELEPVVPVEPTDPEESIGEPGLFQGLPLNCYKCSNAAECGATSVKISVCEGNKNQVCTTAFNARSGSVVARGCSDDLKTECASGSENNCYQCKSNGCNTVKSETDLIDCLFCDGKTTDGCALSPTGIEGQRKCHKSCMTIAYVRNATDQLANYETMRTCLDDLDLDDRESCEAGTYPNCKACNNDKCNTDVVLPDRKSCYHCTSVDDCRNPKTQKCNAWSEEDQCFVEFDETGAVAELGCRSKYDENELKLRISEQRVWLCDTENCNQLQNVPTSKTCSLCSSRTDTNCAIAPNSVNSNTECTKQPYTECYTRILNDGHTERGCLSSLESDVFYNCLYGINGTQCKICSGNNCNKEIYPTERRSCHVCSGDKTPSCASTQPASAQLCLLYETDDTCVTQLGDDGFTHRDCSSSLKCDASDSSKCAVCATDNCNTVNLQRNADANPGMWQSLPLTCYSCNSESACSSTPNTTTTCTGNDHCVTVFAANGNVSQRGCSSAVEATQATYCDANSDACRNCNSNRCNSATSQSAYTACLYCDSRYNKNCSSNPNAVAARRQCNGRCMTATFLRENSKDVLEVTRTCLDDKDEADQLDCANSNGTRCAVCSGTACNTAIIPPNRLSCYHCSGSDCEDPVAQGCSGWRENDECFILFNNQNDVVRMGCISDLTDTEVTINKPQLITCSNADNCNTFNLIPTPKSCVSCRSTTDERCANHPDRVPTMTQCNTVPNVECYTLLNSDGSTERGCVGDLARGNMLNCLSGNVSDCTTCLGDRCNIEIFPADRLYCHRCNSDEDSTCTDAPDAGEACPVYRNDQRCSAKIVDGITYRGCSWDFTCIDSNKQYCRMCDGNNCNSIDLASQQIGYPGKWQDPPINCYTCVDGECANGALGTPRKCEDNLQQNCATVFASNGTVVQRGCTDIVYGGAYGQYCDDNPELCKFCKSNGCNIATTVNSYIDCIFCDGLDSRDCVFEPTSISRHRSCHQKCVTAHYAWPEAQGTYIMSRTCLDDLDPDDLTVCDNGNDPTCRSCTGSNCNTGIIPTTRLHCNRCSGSDCSQPRSETCSAYRADDQCFTLFVEGDNVERMGCLSELSDSLVAERKRRLFLCNGDNCNTAANYPKPQACIVCDTRTWDGCATNVQTPPLQAACDDLPYTQCYTHLDSYGHTKRGCLVDAADPNFDNCLNGNDTNCVVCTSNSCNTDLIPTVRHSCNRCNSDDDLDCATNAAKYAESCPIYKENDQCVTMLSGEKTYRGCASDFSCDPNKPDTCRICSSGNNCNTINLLTASVGNPGTWQDLPLNCYHCDNTADCTSSLGKLNMCATNSSLQTCMTVFNTDGSVDKRGCSDLVLATHSDYCDEHDGSCYKCKSNGCNNVKTESEYIDCYFCNSVQGGASCSVAFTANANARTRKCKGSCMVALYPRSSTNPLTYELTRSCADDMEFEDAEKCAQGLLPDCVSCTSARCNTAVLPNDSRQRLSCYKCVGEGCESPSTQSCSAYREDDQCYIVFDHESSIVGMGCRSEYEDDVLQALIRQKQMLLCDGRNCNSPSSVPTPKMCSVCDSAGDSRCATNPNLIGNSERCAAVPYTDCFTRITASGHTQRGCLASLPAENFQGCLNGTDTLCELCSGDNCNEIDVYPANRLKCHQCNSALDPLCTTAPDSSTVCPLYVRNDVCVTNLRNGETSRGCKSTMTCDDPNDRHTCRTCTGSGCNTANLELSTETNQPGVWQGVPITCYTCANATDCAAGTSKLSVCENDPYQQCVTIFNQANAVEFRGCQHQVSTTNTEYCTNNPTKCMNCNSNGCNSVTSISDYIECYECDTYTNPDCATSTTVPSKTRLCNKQCVTALYPLTDESRPSFGQVRSCLDDMDLDDRDDCLAGKKENCVACSTAKCNTVAIPTKRRSCYICTGDDCQSPKTNACPLYREDDQCYIRYDEQRSIVAMGCGSEFSNAESHYLVSQKRLFYCDGDNCNTFDNLPASQSCTLCSSRTDTNCAVKPDSVLSTTTCSFMPYTQCYMRVLQDGATERGCLSSLYDDEFVGCLNGTSTNCEACTGTKCNNAVYPTGRRSCHICNSATDANCESQPDSLSICPWYAEDDSCVTAFISGETRRGCSSELICDTTNSRTCVKCEGDGCNTVNLAKKQDDNIGKWQDLPLNCLTCMNTTACANANIPSERCENNNEQDCRTIFDQSGAVVRRGCSDAVEAEYDSYCDQNTNSCYECKSNDCNTAKSISDYSECVYCDTATDLNCVWHPTQSDLERRKCQGGCMTALYPAYTPENNLQPTYETIRTCANDKETEDQTICRNGGDSKCVACTGANCNTVNLPTDRHSCYVCQGESCEDPEILACPLYREQDQCFIWFDSTNSIGQMGCLSSFRDQELETVLKTKRVTICDGINCNKPNIISSPQKCVVCNSKDNKLCATNAQEVGTIDTCGQLPYTECYSKLNTDGSTQRGCLSDLESDTFVNCLLGNDENCGVCKGNVCNRDVFPADRLQCYTCTSLDDANCESNPTRKEACAVVKATEGCVSALGGNTTVRGCSSDLYCDTTDSKTCRRCYDTECNAVDLYNHEDDGLYGVFQSLPLRCHTCNGTQCLNSLGEAVTCSGDINQDCMTVFDLTSGNVLRRGCAVDVENYEYRYCRDNPNACFSCKSNECNDAWSTSEYIKCISCDSSNNAMCVTNPSSNTLGERSCNKECLVAVTKNGDTLRTCLDDKELYDRQECRDGSNKECSACSSAKCNTAKIPEDRLMCYICDSSTSCTAPNAEECLKYDQQDFCFARYDNGRIALMGCGSAQNTSDLQSWEDENRLYRCEGKQCNDLSRLPSEGQCVSCDSSKTPDCAQNPTDVTYFETCLAPYSNCITRVDWVGNTLRGCASQLSQTTQDACVANGTCVICDGTNCNNQLFPANRRKCHICNSVQNSECIDKPNSEKICPIYEANDRCVARNTDNDYVERGCASSQLTCDVNDAEHCQICDSDGCNTADMGGGAAIAAAGGLLFTLLIAFIATNLF